MKNIIMIAATIFMSINPNLSLAQGDSKKQVQWDDGVIGSELIPYETNKEGYSEDHIVRLPKLKEEIQDQQRVIKRLSNTIVAILEPIIGYEDESQILMMSSFREKLTIPQNRRAIENAAAELLDLFHEHERMQNPDATRKTKIKKSMLEDEETYNKYKLALELSAPYALSDEEILEILGINLDAEPGLEISD